MLAAVGVGYLTVQAGEFPLIALILAFSFGFYGLLRKTMAVDGLVGLTAETTLLLPLALGYLLVLSTQGALVFGHHGFGTDVLLVAAGAVTALPLLWFANAARRLDYATVGFLQYLAPSLQFLLAVSVYG
jgi:chloramphenicol-sensitive protein RarD